MKKKSENPKANQLDTDRLFFVWLPIAILIGIIGIVMFNIIATYLDKQRFDTVAASVNELHDRLQAESEPGVEWKFRKFCSQGSVKFQTPQKACQIVTETFVELDNDQQAKS